MNIKHLFFSEKGLRAGWRILLFCFLLVIIFIPTILLLILIPHEIIFKDKRLFSILNTFPIFINVFLCSFIMTRFIDKRAFRTLGFALHSAVKKEIIAGVSIGFIMISLVFFSQLIFGIIEISLTGTSIKILLINFIIYLIIFAIQVSGEEALFRGYIFQTLIWGTNKLIAVIIIALSFGFLHLFNPNASLFAAFNVSLSGILFSITYIKTRSLWLPIAVHFSWNFFQGFVYSFPVSGLKINPSLLTVKYNAPELITGGGFGPEGGIIASIVFLSGIFYISLSKRFSITDDLKTILPENYK